MSSSIFSSSEHKLEAQLAYHSPHGINDFQEDVSQLLILGKHNRGCHCKRSGCLRKYCECYQANIRCSENCRCRDCKNFEGSQEIIQQIRTNAAVNMSINRKRKADSSHSVAARYSSAVPPHLVQNHTEGLQILGKHNRGCNCKRSRCRKNYCHCFQTNVRCSDKCRCRDCKNFQGRTNPAVKVAIGMSCYLHPLESIRNSASSHSLAPRGSSVVNIIDAKELCSLLVSKSVEVANQMSGANEKDSSLDPAQRDDANVINNDSPDCVLEKPMSPATRALDEDVRTSQEKEDNDASSETYAEQEKQILSCFRDHLRQILKNGKDLQKANTDPSRKEPEDEEQNNRD